MVSLGNMIGLLLLLSACASGSLNVESTPAGAEVLSANGDVLGKTPLMMESELLDKAEAGGIIALRLRAPGHITRDVFAPASSTRELSVKLMPADEQSFRNETLGQYSKEQNRILREAFRIQNLVQLGKAAEAKPLIDQFVERYPALAFSHIMLANLEIIAGRQAAAQVHLARAAALDPGDPVIQQMRKMTDGGAPQ
jgi:hypothetical protein